MKGFRLPIDFLCLLCLIALAGGCARSDNATGPKAVFLIVVDTLRPDRLSCYGYAANDTPQIDRLARRGVVFERAQAAASWTVPSMGAIMTSRYPTQLGLFERRSTKSRYAPRERRKQVGYTIPGSARTLAEMMRGAGFRTAAFVNQIFLNTHQGFMQGFDEWCRPVSNTEVGWVNPHHPPPDEPLPDGTELGQVDGTLVNTFIDWLQEAGRDRLFVWLHLLRPHWPYLPPPDRMDGHSADWLKTAPASDLYDLEISVTDEDIRRVLDAIDDVVGLDQSVVIFTSDHGEAFGEHGGEEHGHSLHTEVTHVPLVVSAPGLASGRRVETRVRTVDVVPTVLDLVSLQPDSSWSLEGESLVPLVSGEGGDRPTYAAGMLYGGTERSLTKDGFRIMYDHDRGKRFFLYDIDNDPLELEDVAESHGDRVQSMREELRERYMRYLRDFRETRESSHDQMAEEVEQENDKVLRAMKSLGYIK